MKHSTSFKLKRFKIFRDIYAPSYSLLDRQDISTHVKKKCDEELGGTWHCIAGRNFGCSITHDTKYALFFQIEQTHFLIFKSLE